MVNIWLTRKSRRFYKDIFHDVGSFLIFEFKKLRIYIMLLRGVWLSMDSNVLIGTWPYIVGY